MEEFECDALGCVLMHFRWCLPAPSCAGAGDLSAQRCRPLLTHPSAPLFPRLLERPTSPGCLLALLTHGTTSAPTSCTASGQLQLLSLPGTGSCRRASAGLGHWASSVLPAWKHCSPRQGEGSSLLVTLLQAVDSASSRGLKLLGTWPEGLHIPPGACSR